MECTAQRISINVYIQVNYIPNQDTEHFYHQESHLKNPIVEFPGSTVLRLYTFAAKGRSLIPGQELRIHKWNAARPKTKTI